MMNAEKIVKATIKKHHLIVPGDYVVLGLSGGPDSLCLLHILTEFRKELGFSLSCVHLNHLMRGEKAEEDVLWLRAYCAKLDVPLTVEHCDVRETAKKKGISVEEAGRIARQNALWSCGEKLKKSEPGRVLIAFAHNRDDQAETVLMRIFRGTGVHGLSAMEYSRADGMIRPLLDTPRKAVEDYCFEHNLNPRWDYTNASKEFTRNKLRLDLIPSLQKEYNPGLKECLVRLANNAREDDSFLELLACENISNAIFFDTGEQGKRYASPYIEYKLSDMANLNPAVGKRLIKLLFGKLGLQEDIASSHLNSLWDALQNKKHGTICTFPQYYKAEIAYDKLLFYRKEDSQGDFPGKCDWILKQTRMPINEAPDPKSLSDLERVFDAEKIQGKNLPLRVRTRLPGDYIQPLGFSGTKKIQDYFVDAKVERRVRDTYPLVCMGHEVVWVFKGPISDQYKISETTEVVLLLELQQRMC